MNTVLKIFSGIFYFFLGLTILVIGGYLLMVTLFLGIGWVLQTNWWEGVMAIRGDMVYGIALFSLVFFGILFLNWVFKD